MSAKTRPLVMMCSLLVGVLVVGTASITSASEITLPSGDFPQCTDSVTTYCISDVVFIENGVEKTGNWVPSGTATNDVDGLANTTSFTTFDTVDTNYPGRWSYNGFPIARSHDGVYVRAYAPNGSLGSDLLRIGIEPAGPLGSATGQVGRIKDASTGKVGSLDKSMGIKVKVRLGGLNPALNLVAGENVVVSRTTDGTTPILTLQATPTLIPIVSSSTVCKSSDGKADALVNQLYMYVLWSNGTTPFGSGGLTGNMTVTSNGFCSLSAPAWDATNQTFDFIASAPHFAPNGSDVNLGFYRAVIPAVDAKVLFSLDPTTLQLGGVSSQALLTASTALEVEITETDGSQKTFSKNIAFDGSNFIVSAFNFTFSSPKIRLKKSTPTSSPAVSTSGSPASGTGNVGSSIPSIKVKGTLSSKSLAKIAALTVSRGGKVTLAVATSSRSICRVSGASLRGVKKGTCKVKVTVTNGKKKSIKTVKVKVS